MLQVRAVSLSLGRAPPLRLPLVSQCASALLSPGTVVCTHCGCVMLSRSFLFLPPHPLSLSHCPSEAPADPPLLAAALLEVVSAESPGVGLAVGRLVAVPAGAQEGRRTRVRGGDLCFIPGTCPAVLPYVLPPSQQGTWLYFFSFSSLHFLPFSLCLSLSFLLSLSLSLFFFVFLPENQSEERGRVKRESARKAGTNHPACTFVSSACRFFSLPLPKPIRLLAAHSNLTFPSQSLVGCRSCRGSAGGGTALALRASQGRWL